VGGAGAVGFGDVISDGAEQSWRDQPVQVRASLLETLFCCSAGASLWHETAVLRVPTNVCSWWKSGHAADITAKTDFDPQPT
jgi:hypothetical protein